MPSTPRLPIPGADDGTWGDILNQYLSVEHNIDGTLKPSGSLANKADLQAGAVPAAQLPIGTGAGTVAAGDDPRITGALSATGAAGTYARLPASPDQGLWVAPTGGNDANDGLSPGSALATLTAALAKLPAGAASRGKIYLLPGVHILSTGVVAVADNVEICGAGGRGQSSALGGGPGATTLIVPDGAVGLTLGDGTNRFRGPVVRNLHVKANSSASLGGIRLRGYSNWLLENVSVSGFTAGYGVFFDAGGAGLTMYGEMRSCTIADCQVGADIYGASGVMITGTTFDMGGNNAGVVAAGTTAIKAHGTNAQIFAFGTRIQSYSTHYDLSGGEGSQLVGVRSEGFDIAVQTGQNGVAVFGGEFNNFLYATAQTVSTIGTALKVSANITGYRWFPSDVALVTNELMLDSTSNGVFLNSLGTFSSGFSSLYSRFQVSSRSSGAIAGVFQGFTGQSVDIFQVRDENGSVKWGANKAGVPFTRVTSTPLDSDVLSGQAYWFLDQTPGLPRIKFKGKDSAGTVFTNALLPATVATSEVSLSNNIVETALFTFTVPANTAQIGTTYRIKVTGSTDNIAASGTLTFRLRIGGTAGASLAGFGLTAQSSSKASQYFSAEYSVTFRAAGTSGSVIGGGLLQAMFSGQTASVGAVAQSVNTSVDQPLVFTAQWAIADPGNVVRLETATCELIKE